MKSKSVFIFLFILIFEVQAQTPYFYIDPERIDTPRTPFRKAGVPLITDLDKDGLKEIIFFVLDYDGTVSPVGKLYIIDSDGENYSGFPMGFNDYALDITSGDIDGDGYLDIAMRFTDSIMVIDRLGNNLNGFTKYYSDGDIDPTKFISLYDLDNDKKLEIIVSKKNEICVFNFDGTIRSGWPRYIPGRAWYNPAIGDIDGDGFGEIIINSFKLNNTVVDSGMVNIFKQNGSSYSNNWPKILDTLYYFNSSSPSLFINKNNYSLSYFTVVMDHSFTNAHKFCKYDFQGNLLNVQYQDAIMAYGTLVMGDLDRDNNLEFVSGTQYGNTLSAFNNNLNKIDGWPQWGVGEHEATAVIGKMKYGEELNVINNRWSATDEGGYIQVYTKNGINLPWSPLRPFGLVKAVALADLNNDGSVELICTSSRSWSDTYLHIWTIPGIPYTNEDFPWPQYGHDRYRTNQYGFIPPDEPVGILPSSAIVPEKFSLKQNYPNPFNPITTIRFDIRISAFTKLTIFDALGREIETLVNEKLSPGSYSLVFDGSKFTSGVYFYRLTSENFTETKKMLMIK